MQTNHQVQPYEIIVLILGALNALIIGILGTAAATGLVLSLPIVVGLTSAGGVLTFLLNRLQALGSSMGPQVNLTLAPEPTHRPSGLPPTSTAELT